jgi:REP element-mobilizing transposase RayT
VHDHGLKADVRAAVVMPDHVHLIFTPLINEKAREVYSLAEIMDAIKGASAHLINRLLVRSGRVCRKNRSIECCDARRSWMRRWNTLG